MYPYDTDEDNRQNLMPTTYPTYQGRPPQAEGFLGKLNQTLGGGAQNQWYGDQGLVNPQAQAAGQFFNNAKNWGQRGGSRQNPMQAYQQAVALNANTRQKRDMIARNADPYWSYEEGKRRGHVPEDMSYFDYTSQARTGFGAKNSSYAPTLGKAADGSRVMMMPVYNQKTGEMEMKSQAMPEGWEPDSGIKEVRRGNKVDLYRTKDGQYLGSNDIGVSPDQEPALKFAQQEAGSQEAQDSEFRQAAASVPELDVFIGDTQKLMNEIKSGQFKNTGFFEGRAGRFTDRETAKLYAKQVSQALKNLQITNLAPVTENEIRMIEGLYASVLQDPEANIGALEAALEMLVKRKQKIQTMGQYWQKNNGTLKDYGIYEMSQGGPAGGGGDDDPQVDF